MVIEKQSGMATKQMSPKSHGSAGKLAAVHDKHNRAGISRLKNYMLHGTNLRSSKRVAENSKRRNYSLLTRGHFSHVYDFGHDGARQRLKLSRVDVYVRHNSNC